MAGLNNFGRFWGCLLLSDTWPWGLVAQSKSKGDGWGCGLWIGEFAWERWIGRVVPCSLQALASPGRANPSRVSKEGFRSQCIKTCGQYRLP